MTIRSLNQLAKLVREKRSVLWGTGSPRPHPAAFIFNLPGVMLHRMFEHGTLRAYTPKKRSAHKAFPKLVRSRELAPPQFIEDRTATNDPIF